MPAIQRSIASIARKKDVSASSTSSGTAIRNSQRKVGSVANANPTCTVTWYLAAALDLAEATIAGKPTVAKMKRYVAAKAAYESEKKH